jgi:hypothetical protein
MALRALGTDKPKIVGGARLGRESSGVPPGVDTVVK